jgi:DNA gyrase subunit B
VDNKYTAESIEVLEGLEPVRKRPAMYIGGTDKTGYHHLLWEIVDNSVDEAINGHATHITLTLDSDLLGASVSDNGRGIPVDTHKKTGKSALEVIFCTLHAGGKFEGKNYAVSGGLHGVGSSVVNALSSLTKVTVRRDGHEYSQSFCRGKPTTSLVEGDPTKKKGTEVYFKPDPLIFGKTAKFDISVVRDRLESKSYLHRGLKVTLVTSEGNETFEHPDGISDYLGKIVKDKNFKPISTVLSIQKDSNPRLEFCLIWTEHNEEWLRSYANGIPTHQGGTHETGFKAGVVKAIRSVMQTKKVEVKGLTIAAEDIREGLIGIVSIYVPEPQFQGQTKDKLNNTEVSSQVEFVVKNAVERWLIENPTLADAILARIILAARARAASKAAHNQVSRKTATSHRVTLPGKLSDCASTNAKDCEIFLVEGDSAGGNAKQGRDRKTQAILPLRGKVLNIERASAAEIVKNKELQDIISALGCGIGKDFDISKLRYRKIILLMDADSDGHHISTLLLTFFYRLLPNLIRKGHVYLAQPPLYRIDAGKETYWALDDKDKAKVLESLPKNVKSNISRFKGLGEMSFDELKMTTLDPKKRKLLRVTIPEEVKTDQVINELMGKDASSRFKFIMENSALASELDI